MKKSTKIHLFSVVLLMYLPVASSGYFIYGKELNPNILETVCQTKGDTHCKKGLTIAVEILITLHLLMGFVIVLNPFCQEMESKFKVPSRKLY